MVRSDSCEKRTARYYYYIRLLIPLLLLVSTGSLEEREESRLECENERMYLSHFITKERWRRRTPEELQPPPLHPYSKRLHP